MLSPYEKAMVRVIQTRAEGVLRSVRTRYVEETRMLVFMDMATRRTAQRRLPPGQDLCDTAGPDFIKSCVALVRAEFLPQPQKTPFRPGRSRVRLPMQLRSYQRRAASMKPHVRRALLDGTWRTDEATR